MLAIQFVAGAPAEARHVRKTNWPVLKFAVTSLALIVLYYALTFTAFVEGKLFPWHLRQNAEVAGAVLRLLGEGATVEEARIVTPAFYLDIIRGCDALDPLALFLAVTLAFPAPVAAKIRGVVLGTVCILAFNVLRIVGLVYAGIYAPEFFDLIHLEVGQVIFIFFVFFLWMMWVRSVLRRKIGGPAHA